MTRHPSGGALAAYDAVLVPLWTSVCAAKERLAEDGCLLLPLLEWAVDLPVRRTCSRFGTSRLKAGSYTHLTLPTNRDV